MVKYLKQFAGVVVGLLEMFGLKYPVKVYASQVSHELWRGSRLPNMEAYAQLKRQGIKAIVNLCAENDMDRKPCDTLGMPHFRIPILDNTPPSERQMELFLSIIKMYGPVFVHCEAGVGRTGCAVAYYRVKIDRWHYSEALREARTFGLCLPLQEAFIRRCA